MVRKDKKKSKPKIVLSLAEFNEDPKLGLGVGYPELAALPSAPKAPEEWEAEGGRPEYNSRGYRERNQGRGPGGFAGGDPRRERDGAGGGSSSFGNENFDDDHDWSRRGPLDATDSSFGAPADVDRDWGDMRRAGSGPVDEVDGQQQQGGDDRDWTGMRRGPVDATFSSGDARGAGGGAGAGERDWTMRKGPVDAEADLGSGMGGGGQPEADWRMARGGNVVDAEFEKGGKDVDERDWAMRKAPVEAGGNDIEERDWTMRKGPVEAEISTKKSLPFATDSGVDDDDWSAARKGPVESEFKEKENVGVSQTPAEERDWSERRPVEAVGVLNGNKQADDDDDDDWVGNRVPVEAEIPLMVMTAGAEDVENRNDNEKEHDWADVRRGGGVGAVAVESDEKEKNSQKDKEAEPERSWTRRGPVRSKAEEYEEANVSALASASVEGRGQDQRQERHFNERGAGRGRRGGASRFSYGNHHNESEENGGGDGQESGERGSWRRDGGGVSARGRRGRGGRPSSVGHGQHASHRGPEQGPEQSGHGHRHGGYGQERGERGEIGERGERDWGVARRSMPTGREAREFVSAAAATEKDNRAALGGIVIDDSNAANGESDAASVRIVETAAVGVVDDVEVEGSTTTATTTTMAGVEFDEWTTVKSNPKRDAKITRRGGGVVRAADNQGRWRGSGRGSIRSEGGPTGEHRRSRFGNRGYRGGAGRDGKDTGGDGGREGDSGFDGSDEKMQSSPVTPVSAGSGKNTAVHGTVIES